MNLKEYKVLSFFLGLLATVSQIVLLRELVTVFYGNEIVYAVVLGSWLFWVSVGSFLATRVVSRIKNTLRIIFIVQTLLFFLLPLTLVFIRLLKMIAGIHIGEMVGLIPMGVMTFLVLAPATFLFGLTYVFICHLLFSQRKQKNDNEVSTIYFLESMGSACGGVLFSFLLIHILSAMFILFLVGFLNLMSLIFLYRSKKNAFVYLVVCFIVSFALSPQISLIDRWSRSGQWKGLDLISRKDSIYGNITITQLGDEYSLFENGLLSFSTRDSLASEELVHYPMLSHANPRTILLIGNGLDGSLRELSKYPSVQVDYVQLDPQVIQLALKYFPSPQAQILKKPFVQTFYQDARFFVKRQKKRYDVVLINLADPFTAVINRYYSKEFFQELSEDLNPNAIVALSVASSENYLSDENRWYLQALHTTLKSVFQDVKAIPGDTNIFLASNAARTVTRNPDELIARIEERGIHNQYVDKHYIPFKLSPDRIAYIDKVLDQKGRINTDVHPIAYLFDIVLWSTHFNHTYKKLIESLLGVNWKWVLMIPLGVLVFLMAFLRKNSVVPVSFSILSTGFSEIVFQLIVIVSFQTLYGYAYYRIGLIIASFMLGLALGSLYARKKIAENKSLFSLYKKTQLGISMYPLILIGIYAFFKMFSANASIYHLLSLIYAFLPFLAGLMGGVQYPLATKILEDQESQGRSLSQIAGFLYATDVFGAAFGAVISAAFLIPLVGIYSMAIFTALLNFIVYIWICLIREK